MQRLTTKNLTTLKQHCSAFGTKITTQKLTTKKRRMVANLLGIVIGIVLTAAIGGGLYLSTSGILDNASSIASIEIHNARAYNSGDAGYISMSIKNTGTEAATVTIAEILLDCSVANDGHGCYTRLLVPNVVLQQLQLYLILKSPVPADWHQPIL